jgi:hypothetical protein
MILLGKKQYGDRLEAYCTRFSFGPDKASLNNNRFYYGPRRGITSAAAPLARVLQLNVTTLTYAEACVIPERRPPRSSSDWERRGLVLQVGALITITVWPHKRFSSDRTDLSFRLPDYTNALNCMYSFLVQLTREGTIPIQCLL